MQTLVWMLMAYLAGAVPFGLFLARTCCGVDPRTAGSHNTGATNVARLCGTKIGVLVMVLDILKGVVPVWAAVYSGLDDLTLSLIAMSAVCGHVYSVFLGFKGGKAVATTVGVMLPLCFGQALLGIVLCLTAIFTSGFVSMGSLTFAASMPILLLITGRWGLVPLSVAILILIFWRHRDNIARLAAGEEKPWRKSKQ